MPARIQVHLLEETWGPHICALQEANAAHTSTASSVLNTLPGGFFFSPSFFLVEKKALRVILSHHGQEARVRLGNGSPLG